jgi:hypothetical protein
MDHGPSRREHFGARGGSPPQVGCADRPHPRRLGAGHSDLRIGGETSSSDRVSAVPVNTMTVWPEPALQLAGDEPEPRAAKGPPPGESTARPTRRSFGKVAAGHGAALFGVRASGAQTSTPPGVNVCGERSLHQVRGRPRKDGEHELEPPDAALRSERWVANESLRRCVAMTSETACLRVYGPTRWISSRGRFTGIPFVARRGCGRGDSPSGDLTEPPRSSTVVPSGTTGR